MWYEKAITRITWLRHLQILLLAPLVLVPIIGVALEPTHALRLSFNRTQPQTSPTPRIVELKASDGTVLKASYFAAAKSGPGVLLLHQVNRTRREWNDLAAQLAFAGINTLTLDMRGHGESGGPPYEKLTSEEARKVWGGFPDDIETAFQFLISQPGVNRDCIGLGGAGVLGVDLVVEVARKHPNEVKSLVLLSGETFHDGLQFLHEASQLPALFVVADTDEYPPTVEAMELLYVTSTNPGKKFIHYSASHDAPWLWYEPFDLGKVPATGSHGTDLFKTHAELPGQIVDWFVTTLIKTPGYAPANTVAAAAIINQIQTPGGVASVTQQLIETRKRAPNAQLFPEVTVSIIGWDYLRVGQTKSAIEVLKLVLLAYPDSAAAHDSLADAYLADGQKELALQHAKKALDLLNSHTSPASSWTDTEQYRGRIRGSAEGMLKRLAQSP